MRSEGCLVAPQVNSAVRFAEKTHGRGVDHTGRQIMSHVRAVALWVAMRGGSNDQIAAAWLHQTVELGGAPLHEIRRDFPREVADMVGALTRRDGETLDDHFDDAFKQIFAQDFDSILSIGADIPMLPREHLLNGFRWLQYFLATSENGGVIHAPCQESGVSLIGWTRDTDIDHQGINGNTNGRPALDLYVEKAKDKEIPLALMMPVSGIDDVSDFAHATSLSRAAKYSQQFQPDLYVPERFLAWVDWRGIKVGTPPENTK